MSDRKFTDDEVIKALECCIKAETWGDCEALRCPASTKQGCYFYLRTDDDYENTIYVEMFKDALDLINRQKAEIERLRYNLEAVLEERADHTEAIKEFADKVIDLIYEADDINAVSEWQIRNLVKEMTEGGEPRNEN